MDEITVSMDKLHFWHQNPCDDDPNIPGGICRLLNIDSIQHKNVVEIFNRLKGGVIAIEDNPRIKYYRNLGENGIYSARDNKQNPIIVKRINDHFYLSEGYHRVFALLFLNVKQLKLNLIRVEVPS